MNIRELINAYRNEIKTSDLQPERASEILVEIVSLLGNINDEIRISEIEYNKKLLECYKVETKANRAKILAETSPEYERKRIARDTKDEAIEIVRGLKYFLKAKEQEFQATR